LRQLQIEAIFEEGSAVTADAETIFPGLITGKSDDEGIGSSDRIVTILKNGWLSYGCPPANGAATEKSIQEKKGIDIARADSEDHSDPIVIDWGDIIAVSLLFIMKKLFGLGKEKPFRWQNRIHVAPIPCHIFDGLDRVEDHLTTVPFDWRNYLPIPQESGHQIKKILSFYNP